MLISYTHFVMMVILGSDHDPNAQRLIDHAHMKGVDYYHVDPNSLASFRIGWTLQKPELRVNDDTIHPTSLYLRHSVFDPVSEGISHTLHTNLQAFAQAHETVRVMNRRTIGSVNDKSKNLAHAYRIGLPIPKTAVIASDLSISQVAEIEGFENVIAKPLTGGGHAIHPKELTTVDRTYANSFIQQMLPGRNVRVFVINDQPFAFALATTALDYRTDNKTKVTEIDPANDERDADEWKHIFDLSRQLAREIGFDYCALDFRGDVDGTQVFLEINSFPMYTAFDNACAHKLVEAQLNFLTGS